MYLTSLRRPDPIWIGSGSGSSRIALLLPLGGAQGLHGRSLRQTRTPASTRHRLGFLCSSFWPRCLGFRAPLRLLRAGSRVPAPDLRSAGGRRRRAIGATRRLCSECLARIRAGSGRHRIRIFVVCSGPPEPSPQPPMLRVYLLVPGPPARSRSARPPPCSPSLHTEPHRRPLSAPAGEERPLPLRHQHAVPTPPAPRFPRAHALPAASLLCRYCILAWCLCRWRGVLVL